MADNSSSILSEGVSPEQAGHLRELFQQPGWAVLRQAILELRDSSVNLLCKEEDSNKFRKQQGRIEAFNEVLTLKSRLMPRKRS